MVKRKLLRAAERQERRKSRAEEESDAEEDEQELSDVPQLEEAEKDSSEDDESAAEEGEEEPRRVRGVLSAKDKKILDARRAEQARIDNIVPYRNKQRVLIFCSRGVTSRFRHLMEDMRSLLPHHRKDVKHDTKKNLHEINDVCDMKGCNNCLFFEARKSKDLYMWLSKTPNGPSIKFHVLNIHTMDELRLSGNCLKGSRPLLSFGQEFEVTPALQLVKEMFVQIFGTPNGHPKVKPFVDHVMSFSLVDGKIWFRHFQITDTTQNEAEIRRALKRGEETVKLVEIGPRFVLNLIKIFEGSFGGRTICENPEYVTPNAQRSEAKRGKGNQYKRRKVEEAKRAERTKKNVLPKDELRALFN